MPPKYNAPGIYDDKLVVEDASERFEKRGIALPLLLDLARKPIFLHDASVRNLDELLNPTREATAPHPFYRGVSNLVGVIEVTTALLIAVRPWSALLSAIGSAMAVVTFLITLSFIFSTPNIVDPAFPGISAFPGQFLMKDVLLLGGSLWSLGESLEAWNIRKGD